MKHLALAAALVAALPAHAQQPQACGPTVDMLARLASEHGETQAFVGMTQAGEVLLITASQATGTWSALAVRADGSACMFAWGESGQVTLPVLPIPGVLN
jgi:hypothetical protein